MNKHFFFISVFVISKSLLAGDPVYPKGFEPKKQSQTITFTENKGQVSDQHHKPRPDVLFGGNANGMVFHLRNNGISYQLSRVDSWKTEDTLLNPHHGMMRGEKRKIPDKTIIYRVDINWLNFNKNFTLQKADSLPGYGNYYQEVCPVGVHHVKTYNSVTYKNIYNDIDLHYYQKDGNLKYDYIVAPHADYKKIKLEINGAQKICLQKDGSLLLLTPIGEISEGTPLVFQNGKHLSAKWIISGNTLQFEIEDYNPNQPLLIDPLIRAWGTYYGSTNSEEAISCASDVLGNVYMGGGTASTTGTIMATTGAHQVTYGGGVLDALLAKFNSFGVRQWATYYGGADNDYGYSCKVDPSGNVLLCGQTTSLSTSGIATPGAHQTTYGGGNMDAFLVKFNTNGVRIWGTYYGGLGHDSSADICLDASGDIYMTGITGTPSGTAIATLGAHNTSFGGPTDAYLVKFNSAGLRLWATYYGGPGSNVEDGTCCTTDAAGNVYLGGITGSNSGTAIATPASHQPTPGLSYDAFLVKFSSLGVRQWGTFYGGNGPDYARACATDPAGNIFLAGQTNSNSATGIATPGSHQPVFGWPVTPSGFAYNDAFLVKFNTNGVRQWGTYYGGSGHEVGFNCSTDSQGNVYLLGESRGTPAGTVMTTPGAYQVSAPSANTADAFLVKFDNNGSRLWGTYYGGFGSEVGYGLDTDIQGIIFVAGSAAYSSTSGIASPGAHQTLPGGVAGTDMFLVKFTDDCILLPPPSNITLPVNQTLCANGTTTLQATSTGTISWYSSPVSISVLGTGSTFITPTLSAGVYTFYAESFSCAPSASRIAVTVTVFSSPTITASSGSICSGKSFTIIPSGANAYTFSGGSAIVSPTITTTYSIFGTSTTGCVSNQPATSNITVIPGPAISVNSGVICLGQSFTINPSGANTYTVNGGNFVVSPTSNTSYSVTGTSTAGCISNAAVVSVTVNPLPNVTAVSNPSSICSGESAMLTASGASSYSWFPSGNTNTILVTPNTTTTYSVIGIDNKGCSNTASISILVKPNPTVSVNNATICSGTQAVLNANVNPNTGIVYNWLPGGENSSSITVNPNATTVYSLSVNLDGCLSMATSTVNVVTAITPNVAFSYNGPYCTNQNAVSPILPLTFANGGQFNSTPEGLNINPNTGEINPTTSEPGIYQVTYTLAASGCSTSASGTANIQITVPVQLNLAPQVSMLSGEAYTLNVSGASSYSWSPPEFLSCTDCQNPIASPPYSMTYCVSSPNEVCLAKTCISIYVETGCQGRELALPNAFSPNGDGNNDEYCLRGWNECIAEFKITIYNRWGEKVYESEQTEFCWDGSYKGKTQETEVFVYMLKAKLKDGTQISKNGNITLLR